MARDKSNLMFVEVLLDFHDDGIQFYQDERVMISKENAAYYCENGWAKDPTGKIATKAPDLGNKKLEVQDGKHPMVAPKVEK